MKRNTLKSHRIDKTVRNVKVPCVECRKTLEFRLENEAIVDGMGIIAVNFPGAVCQDCINVVLDRVADPPGLICIRNLNQIIAKELLLSFTFQRPLSDATKFFALLFPETNELKD